MLPSCRMTPPSRLGLIGDVHAEDTLLGLALERLAADGLEAVLCTGDIVDGQGDVDECCRLLRVRDVVTVRGNHDRWFLTGKNLELPHATARVAPRSHRYLSALPTTVELHTARGPLLLCHGVGENDMASVKPDDVGYALESNLDLQRLVDGAAGGEAPRLVVAGHSHVPMVRRLGALVLVNPGTLLRSQTPGFLQLDLATETVIVFRFARGRFRPDGERPLP